MVSTEQTQTGNANSNESTLGFGGSCHWCTEAIFQSLRGVTRVQQGWIASSAPHDSESEAVLVDFDSRAIDLDILVRVHLHTHSCTSKHSMREKYRSAVYTFNDEQAGAANHSIAAAQADFDAPIITRVLPFASFRLNDERYLDYYASNPDKPFCRTYIEPKLKTLLRQFSAYVER